MLDDADMLWHQLVLGNGAHTVQAKSQEQYLQSGIHYLAVDSTVVSHVSIYFNFC